MDHADADVAQEPLDAGLGGCRAPEKPVPLKAPDPGVIGSVDAPVPSEPLPTGLEEGIAASAAPPSRTAQKKEEQRRRATEVDAVKATG